jgi:predicted DNA-binding transcriptional regulator YafY
MYLTPADRFRDDDGTVRSDRLLAILLTLQARGRATAPQLAEQLEVSVRTVYRDVEALSSAGVPVYTEQGRGGGIALLAGYRTDATGLTPAEAQALFTFSGRGVLADDAGDRHLRAAFRKLLAALPESQRAEAERAEQRILVEPRPWRRRAGEPVPTLPAIQKAVLAGERLRMEYQSANRTEPRTYDVDPVGLVVKAGIWYLVAYRDGEPRMFRVGRARRAEPVGPAQLPADVPTLAELWDHLRLRFEQPGGGVRVDLVVPRDKVGWVIGACSDQLIDRPERQPVAATHRDDSAAVHVEPSDPSDGTAGCERLILTFRTAQHAYLALAPVADTVDVIAPGEVRDDLVRLAEAIIARHRPTRTH